MMLPLPEKKNMSNEKPKTAGAPARARVHRRRAGVAGSPKFSREFRTREFELEFEKI